MFSILNCSLSKSLTPTGVDGSARTGEPGSTWPRLLLVALVALTLFSPSTAEASGNAAVQESDPPAAEPAARQAWMVRVGLPIGHQTVQQVEQVLSNLARQAPPVVRPENRPIVILEFATDRGQDGSGSQLPDCMKLAQLLASEEMNRLQTVAWIPAPRDASQISLPGAAPDRRPPGLYGHAVLVAISADLIALDQSMHIGHANIDAPQRDPLAIDIYRNLTSRRLTIPVEVAVAMVDPDIELYSVKNAGKDELVDAARLRELETAGALAETTTLAQAGQTARLDGAQLQRIAPSSRPVRGLAGLSARFQVDLSRIETETVSDRTLVGVRQELTGYIDSRTADLAIRAIEKQVKGTAGANLVILAINSPGGDLEGCLKLARYITGFQRDEVRTAAWIDGQARGPAALVALACDHLLAAPESRLGGTWEPGISGEEIEKLWPELEQLGSDALRDPALLAAMLDSDYPVNRYRQKQSGEVRWMSETEHTQVDDSGQWQILGTAASKEGLTVAEAEQDGIVRAVIGTAREIDAYYQLEDPAVVLVPTRTDAFLMSFARFLANPMVSVWLMFLSFMLIMTELSQPGLGIPGFLGTLFLVLYFWSHYLGGSAEWFEILLFLVGVLFVLVELFVIPGFGVFGITGFLMIVVSIVLAAQTFVIPRNNEELAQLPGSLLMLVGAGGGLVGAFFLIRRILPNTPYFNRLMLHPPVARPAFAEGKEVDRRLPVVGAQGVAVTRLIPSGKARFGGQIIDVITDGVAVSAGEKVEVIQASGNRIVVSALTS